MKGLAAGLLLLALCCGVSLARPLGAASVAADRSALPPVDASGDSPSPAAPARTDTLDFGFYQEVGGEVLAVEGETWTWDHGAVDPLEGWRALDGTPGIFFQQITPASWLSDPLNPTPDPVLDGDGSIWLGLFATPARDSCWANGPGYGNDWRQRLAGPWLTYDGSGDVLFSMKYFADTEPDYDYVYVVLERTGGQRDTLNGSGFNGAYGTPPNGPWAVYTRTITNAELGGGTAARDFRVAVEFISDLSWSDEDGGFTTSYGALGLDDIAFQNNLVGGNRSYPFESGLDDWAAENIGPPAPLFGVAPASAYDFLPGDCRLAGNVAEFHLPGGGHPSFQHTVAWSPPADLTHLEGYEEVFVDYDIYHAMPLLAGIFYRVDFHYFPYACPITGENRWSPYVGDGLWRFLAQDACLSARMIATDWGLPTVCERVRVNLQVTTCEAGPIVEPCEPWVGYDQPLFDNVRIRVIPAAPNAVDGNPSASGAPPARLLGAAPNPVAGGTSIRYHLAEATRLRLEVLDLGGRVVRVLTDGRCDAGPGLAHWDGLDSSGRPLPSGVYWVRLHAGSTRLASRMVLLR